MENQSQSTLQAYDQLTERNRDLRKANVKLLEDKRELLMQVQHGNRAQMDATRLSEICEDLKKKLEVFEIEHRTKRTALGLQVRDLK